MNSIKLYFSILLVAIAALLFLGSLNVSKLDKVNAIDLAEKALMGSVKEYSLVEAKTYSCTVEKPANRTVVLRIDDITPWNDYKFMDQMVTEITSRNYGVSLGIIPNRLEKDYNLIRWLQRIKDDPKVELSQHGYDHSNEEFVNLSYQDAKTKIDLGKEIMMKYFGQIPINFIPPFNVESQETMKAIIDSGFKTFSGSKNEYIVENGFVMAGYTATTYRYDQDRFVYADEVLKNCKDSLDKTGVCVIMIHPQDFKTNGKVDEKKYAEFIKVLDGLKDLNAQVVNFRQAFCKEY